ncbi:40S ribosomal protein S2, putative [Ixodes scapularis]|uniref:40S ribosomal protein S2, putative n=1 Tax=Ixodes scapularis TaxID=6945 RepID=B7Q1B3_IXOSC|nr:40S ribosomal protein S2, putative [Ixodes scapularis]|eukprot:XP_002409244.1 40S ribosomal protein S2, putative [Ixodes scapularis]
MMMRLIPAALGTGIVPTSVPQELLHMAGIKNCYTSARGSNATLGNFSKATYTCTWPSSRGTAT